MPRGRAPFLALYDASLPVVSGDLLSRCGQAPRSTAVSLVLEVPDVDATIANAVAAGAELARPIEESHGSRNAVLIDPFGHRWMVETPLGAS